MVKQRRLGYATITCCALLLSACQPATPPSDNPTPTNTPAASPSAAPATPSPSPSATPSPDPSPSPSAHESFPPPEPGESKEIQAVRKGWEAFEVQYAKYAGDSTLNELTPLSLTTTGQASIDAVKGIGELRDAGEEQRGPISYRNVRISKPQRNKDGYNIAIVKACQDFSQVKFIVVATGKEAEDSKDPSWSRTIEATTVMEQQPNGKWVAADLQGEPSKC